MHTDPKNIKIQSSCQYLFELLGSALVKGEKTINSRLAKRAEMTIQRLGSIKTKKAVVALTKKKIMDEKYNLVCRNRACYICQE